MPYLCHWAGAEVHRTAVEAQHRAFWSRNFQEGHRMEPRGGVMRTKDSQQGFLQFVCLEAFPTSEYLQLSHIQMSTALQARGDPNTHHETAAAESCPCETNAMLKTSQQCQVLTRVRSHRNTCYCWQPCKDGRAHWKAAGRPALFCFQCWELNPEPHI